VQRGGDQGGEYGIFPWTKRPGPDAQYEAELERCKELRRTSLSSFIVGARAEIESLWTELMMSEEEKDFGGFIDGECNSPRHSTCPPSHCKPRVPRSRPRPDDYTEALLEAHETYAEHLRAEMQSKSALLPRVREWHTLVIEEDELERAQNDPDRYKRRGGAMLREEKLRNRVTRLKPRVEEEMLRMIPAWEEAEGRPFMVQGERVVERIWAGIAVKEAAKETKKVSAGGEVGGGDREGPREWRRSMGNWLTE
jgi:protein regulator of cytokinesis 1